MRTVISGASLRPSRLRLAVAPVAVGLTALFMAAPMAVASKPEVPGPFDPNKVNPARTAGELQSDATPTSSPVPSQSETPLASPSPTPGQQRSGCPNEVLGSAKEVLVPVPQTWSLSAALAEMGFTDCRIALSEDAVMVLAALQRVHIHGVQGGKSRVISFFGVASESEDAAGADADGDDGDDTTPAGQASAPPVDDQDSPDDSDQKERDKFQTVKQRAAGEIQIAFMRYLSQSQSFGNDAPRAVFPSIVGRPRPMGLPPVSAEFQPETQTPPNSETEIR